MRSSGSARVTRELVLGQLRRHHFAVLSTAAEDGRPHAAGVSYGVTSGSDPVIYVMTRRHLRKARNVARNPNVALVVPVPRPLLTFLPPATIQLQGRAQIVERDDPAGTVVFRSFWIGRRILEAYEELACRGEQRVCFLRITPDPVARTYMVGHRIWEVRSRMELGSAKVNIAAAR